MHLRVVCLLDWHLEVFYYPYYKIKNAGVHELNFMRPNIYYRTKTKKRSIPFYIPECCVLIFNLEIRRILEIHSTG